MVKRSKNTQVFMNWVYWNNVEKFLSRITSLARGNLSIVAPKSHLKANFRLHDVISSYAISTYTISTVAISTVDNFNLLHFQPSQFPLILISANYSSFVLVITSGK